MGQPTGACVAAEPHRESIARTVSLREAYGGTPAGQLTVAGTDEPLVGSPQRGTALTYVDFLAPGLSATGKGAIHTGEHDPASDPARYVPRQPEKQHAHME